MNQDQLVSIVMPVYNAEKYLSACIQSIINQDYQNWELLVVNDFSTDDSYNVLLAYAQKDRRIQVFQNSSKGIIPALQLAYSNSKGLAITRMDADDIMPINKLSTLIFTLIKHPRKCITGKVKYFSEDALQDGYIRYANWLNTLIDQKSHSNEIFKECVIPSPCWMMSKDVFDKIGAFSSHRYPEDYDLCFRIIANQVNIHGIDQILHLWRDHGARASRNDPHYADQSFLNLKMYYFEKLYKPAEQEIILWGAGKAGKELAKQLLNKDYSIRWVSNNPKKIGHNIYDIIIESDTIITEVSETIIVLAIKEKNFINNFSSIIKRANFNNTFVPFY